MTSIARSQYTLHIFNKDTDKFSHNLVGIFLPEFAARMNNPVLAILTSFLFFSDSILTTKQLHRKTSIPDMKEWSKLFLSVWNHLRYSRLLRYCTSRRWNSCSIRLNCKSWFTTHSGTLLIVYPSFVCIKLRYILDWHIKGRITSPRIACTWGGWCFLDIRRYRHTVRANSKQLTKLFSPGQWSRSLRFGSVIHFFEEFLLARCTTAAMVAEYTWGTLCGAPG